MLSICLTSYISKNIIYCSKAQLNKSIFNMYLQSLAKVDAFTWSGKSFQNFSPHTEKAQSPKVFNLDFGTVSRFCSRSCKSFH